MAALDITINDLTNGSLSVSNEWAGTGVFDKLIAAVNNNIEGQYNKGRITGSDYAQVYLGSMQSVLAQSVEFLLREKETEARVDLLKTQDDNTKIEGAALKAKVLDEHGRNITSEFELVYADDSETKHYHGVDLLTNQVLTEGKKLELTDAQVRAADKEAAMLHGKLEQELNGVYTPATETTPASWAFPKATVTGEDLNWYTTGEDNTRTTNPYLMNLYRQYEENKIAKSTAEGYKADGIYKAYKSLQEMFFALANLGIEPGESDSINQESSTTNNNPYVSIMKSMESLINAHMDVWDNENNIAPIKLTQTS